MSHYSDVINVHGAKPEDVVFILSPQSTCPDEIPAMEYLSQKFPGVDIKFNEDFEGNNNNNNNNNNNVYFYLKAWRNQWL